VYGRGGIEPGACDFELVQITAEYLQERGLAANLDFEDLDSCAKLIPLAADASR
jgi:hypothetical protein